MAGCSRDRGWSRRCPCRGGLGPGGRAGGLAEARHGRRFLRGSCHRRRHFLHVKTEALQQNSGIFGDGKTLDTNRESWIRWDGKTWAIDSRPSAGWREYQLFPRAAEPYLNNPTPESAAALPDDPDAVRTYLDEHVSGSNSHEEAIFVAVCDLTRSQFLPPETLAAALRVLADVDGIETKDVTFHGRPPCRSPTPRSGRAS